jgi:hydrogenase maturation protease
MEPSEKFLLLGLGHPYRSDDGFGPRAIELLKEKFGDRYDYQQHSGDPADLMDVWDQRSLIILDALRTPAPKPGTLHRIHVTEGEILPGMSPVSSHALSLGEALEMGRILRKMPRNLIVLGVEGENFNPGDQLSAAVSAALNQVTTLIPELTEGH